MSSRFHIYLLRKVIPVLALILALLLYCAFRYSKFYLATSLRSFYELTQIEFAQSEDQFNQRLAKIETDLIQEIASMKRKLKRPVKFHFKPKNDKDSDFAHRLVQDYERLLKRNSYFKFQQSLKRILKKYPELNEKVFGLGYDDIFLAFLRLHYFKQISLSEIKDTKVSLRLGHTPLASVIISSWAVQIGHRYEPTPKVDYYFFNPVQKISGVAMDPSQNSFGEMSLLESTYRILFTGLEFEAGDEKRYVKERTVKSLQGKKAYRAFISAFLYVDLIYEAWLRNFKSAHDSKILSLKNLQELKLKESFIFDLGELRRGKAIEKSEELKSMLQEQGHSIKLIRNSGSKTEYIHIIRDSVAGKLVKVYKVSRRELLEPAYKFLKFIFSGLAVLVLILVLITFWTSNKIASPIVRLAKIIKNSEKDLQDSQLSGFKSEFEEVQELANEFARRIRAILNHLHLLGELKGFQKDVLNAKDQNEVKQLGIQIFQDIFELTLDPEMSLVDLVHYLESDFQSVDATPFVSQLKSSLNRFQQELEFQNGIQTKKELGLASQIQEQLMSSTSLLGDHLQSYFKAARFLGGDFMFCMSQEEQTYLCIGDVSGKGLPAALYGASAQALIQYGIHNKYPINECLQKTNDYMSSLNRSGFFCTTFLLEHNLAEQKIKFASAGHNQMYQIQNGELNELSAKGLPLGLMEGIQYEIKELDATAGNTIVLYTDGVNEAENPQQKLFGFERLEELLKSEKGSLLKGRILEELEEFCDGAYQSDDITFMVYQIL